MSPSLEKKLHDCVQKVYLKNEYKWHRVIWSVRKTIQNPALLNSLLWLVIKSYFIFYSSARYRFYSSNVYRDLHGGRLIVDMEKFFFVTSPMSELCNRFCDKSLGQRTSHFVWFLKWFLQERERKEMMVSEWLFIAAIRQLTSLVMIKLYKKKYDISFFNKYKIWFRFRFANRSDIRGIKHCCCCWKTISFWLGTAITLLIIFL